MAKVKGFGFINKFTPRCSKCGLYKKVNTPRMPYTGNGKMKTLIIGEKPSTSDDSKGYPFSGTSGTEFYWELQEFGFDLFEDFWITNIINCYSKKEPTRPQMLCCWPLVQKTIEELQPNHIWLLGSSPVACFYHKQFSNDSGITRFRGYKFPDRTYNAYIWPMFHPNYVLVKNSRDKGLKLTFQRDLKHALDEIHNDKPIFTDDYKNDVQILTSFDEIEDALLKIKNKAQYMAFDYEGSGLKPYMRKHYVYSISARAYECLDRNSEISCISFPLYYPNAFKNKNDVKNIHKLWKEILGKKKIRKIAHHLKFEDVWSDVCLKAPVKGWFWCTKYVAHILDERKKIDALDFQAALKGIPQYDKEVDKFKKAENPNEYNNMHKAPLMPLLLYGGIDSNITGDLFFDQYEVIKNDKSLQKATNLFVSGAIALADAEKVGFPADKKYYDQENKRLEKQINKMEKELLKDPIVSKKLKKYYKEINLESPDQISTLLFDILGIKSKKLTAGGKQSTDAEVLSEIDHPWVQKYSKYKKLIKVKDTFLKGIRTEITDENILHTFYHLHTTRTGRSSSQSPNWQNIPKRDEEAKKITRSGIKLKENEKIGEADYGALEVNIIACTSKDPTLIDYCSDANADPHRDTAADLFLIPSDQVPKKVRFITKNGYVFPEFYGSYYANCAENLWYNSADLTMNDGMPVHDYLREKGIKCLRKPSDKKGQASKGTFEYHVKECEEVFWERFPIVKEWQQDTIDFYYKYGYVENMFGFRRRGYISRNQIVNTPIQGSAFHLLLWSFIQAKKLEKKEKWESKIRGQIHDSILFTATQNEEQHVLNSLKYIMIEKATKTFDWIVVPLTVEIELSKFGGNWANLEKIEI